MQTRSSKKISPQQTAKDEKLPHGSSNIGDTMDTEADDTEEQVKALLKGVKTMKKELKLLREQNSELQQQLQVRASQPNNNSSRHDSKTVSTLKKQIRVLEKANEKAKKKIQSFKRKEVQKDADELQDDICEDEADVSRRRRKLLKEFSNLMVMNTVGEDEECAVCLERLEINKTSSFECQHLVCNGCLDELFKNEGDPVSCPHCRETCPRHTVETVQYTATQRWDMLLECAKSGEALDPGNEDDTSEDEDKAHSIGNGSEDGRSNIERATSGESASEELEDELPAALNIGSNYSSLASPQKRALLRKLAAERESKKRRY